MYTLLRPQCTPFKKKNLILFQSLFFLNRLCDCLSCHDACYQDGNQYKMQVNLFRLHSERVLSKLLVMLVTFTSTISLTVARNVKNSFVLYLLHCRYQNMLIKLSMCSEHKTNFLLTIQMPVFTHTWRNLLNWKDIFWNQNRAWSATIRKYL